MIHIVSNILLGVKTRLIYGFGFIDNIVSLYCGEGKNWIPCGNNFCEYAGKIGKGGFNA